MCFSVGVGRNALPWFQPSASGKEIVASGGARCLRCARMVRIASGSAFCFRRSYARCPDGTLTFSFHFTSFLPCIRALNHSCCPILIFFDDRRLVLVSQLLTKPNETTYEFAGVPIKAPIDKNIFWIPRIVTFIWSHLRICAPGLRTKLRKKQR